MQRILLYGRDEINKQLPKAVISCDHGMAAYFFLHGGVYGYERK